VMKEEWHLRPAARAFLARLRGRRPAAPSPRETRRTGSTAS
jgi:hypothetical protein